MAGIHIEASAQSLSGINYSVSIIDDVTASPIARTMQLAKSVTVNYEGNESMVPVSNIFYSSASFSLWVNDDTDQSYINDLIIGKENQFYLLIEKEGAPYWRGVVLVDQFKRERTSYPYQIEITARDGLSRLDDIAIVLPASTKVNLISYFNDILKEALIQNANFGASEPFISTACRIYEVSMASSYLRTYDPLRYSKVYDAPLLYTKSQNDGVFEYENYGAALKDLLKVWGLILKQYNGRWFIIQADAYNESTLRLHNYTLDIEFATNPATINAGTATQENFTYVESIANNGEVINGEFYSFAPSVRETRMKVVNKENKQVLKFSKFLNLESYTYLADVISGDFSSGVRIRMNVLAGLTMTTWPNNFLLYWRVYIKCGSNYFTNQGGSPRWVTSSSAYYEIVETRSNPGSSLAYFVIFNFMNGLYYDIYTSDIPSSDALEIKIDVQVTDMYAAVQTVTINSMVGDIIVDYYNYNVTDAPYDEIQYIHGTNTDSSFIYDLGETQIADDPGTIFNGKLMIHNGTTWVDSEEWKRYAATDTGATLVEQLLRIYYNNQQKVLQILNASIINPDVKVVGTITVDSLKLSPQRVEFNLGSDTCSGSFIEIGTYAVGTGVGVKQFDDTLRTPFSLNSSSGQFGKTYQMNVGVLPVTRIDEVITGTVSTVSIVDPGVSVGNVDDELLIINPFNGYSETIVLSAALENGATAIEFDSKLFKQDFPAGSIVSIPMKSVVKRLFALENP